MKIIEMGGFYFNPQTGSWFFLFLFLHQRMVVVKVDLNVFQYFYSF